MKTGRNDPCPCGSGKKYKKCCLSTSQGAPTRPVAAVGVTAPSAAQPRAIPVPTRLPTLPPPPPPRPRDPAAERWKARWEEFKSKKGEDQIAVFLQTLDDRDLMDDEVAFEMLNCLRLEAIKHGERRRFAEVVAALRERRPEVYDESSHFYLSWRVQDALAEGWQDDVPALARELALKTGRDIDVVNQSLRALAYHGRLSVLVEAMRIGWAGVQSSGNVVPWGIAEFANTGANYEIYDYLEQTASPDPADTTLLDRINHFIPEPRLDYVAEFIDDLTGKAGRAWNVKDFALKPPRRRLRDNWDDDEETAPADPAAANLSRLLNEFVGYARRVEGVPFPRADLARKELYRYFLARRDGDLDPRPSMIDQLRKPNKKLPPPPSPVHPLCPERVTLETHLARLVNPIHGLYYNAAALFDGVPVWLRFLASRRMIDGDQRAKNVEELQPLHAGLLRLWEKVSEDPTLYRAGQTWLANAVQGLPQTDE